MTIDLELSGADLPKKSWVKISQIRTLSIQRLGKKIGRTTVEELEILLKAYMNLSEHDF